MMRTSPILATILSVFSIAGCEPLDASAPMALFIHLGIADEPPPPPPPKPSPPPPLLCDIVADPTAFQTNSEFVTQVRATASELAQRPGSRLRLRAMATREDAVCAPVIVDVPEPAAATATNWSADTFVNTATEAADRIFREAGAAAAADAKPDSLIAELLTLIGLEPPTDPRMAHRIIFVTDSRQFRHRSEHPPKAQLVRGKSTGKKTEATTDAADHDHIDFECEAPDSAADFLAYLDAWHVLQPASFTGAEVRFAFAGIAPVDRGRCPFSTGSLLKIRNVWSVALNRAGVSRVQFSSGEVSIN